MSDKYKVREQMFEINLTAHEFLGLPYLVEKLSNALLSVPLQHRDSINVQLHDTVLIAWYDRPMTNEEIQERDQYDALQQKFATAT